MSGQPADSSRFGAAGSALGYLAQVDYALLAALERMDDEDDFALSLETLDDIVFHHAETDDATEKWQSKHTIESKRTLSDASTDLWKTLRNWIVELDDRNARLVLVAVANAGSAAAERPRPGGRGGQLAPARARTYARGEFRTAEPAAKLLVELADPHGSVFDPAVGSAELLIEAARLGNRVVALYGQELNESSWRVAVARLLLRNLEAQIELGDSLREPEHRSPLDGERVPQLARGLLRPHRPQPRPRQRIRRPVCAPPHLRDVAHRRAPSDALHRKFDGHGLVGKVYGGVIRRYEGKGPLNIDAEIEATRKAALAKRRSSHSA